MDVPVGIGAAVPGWLLSPNVTMDESRVVSGGMPLIVIVTNGPPGFVQCAQLPIKTAKKSTAGWRTDFSIADHTYYLEVDMVITRCTIGNYCGVAQDQSGGGGNRSSGHGGTADHDPEPPFLIDWLLGNRGRALHGHFGLCGF